MRLSRTYGRVLLLCLVTAVSFLNYWGYNQAFQKVPDAYLDIVQGTAQAPQQYRILVVRAAWWLHQHAHFGLRHSFGFFDLAASTGSGLILLTLMERSAFFRKASHLEQWLSYAAFLFLSAYYLLWLDWYQRPETLPTTFFLTLMVAVLSWRPRRTLHLAVLVLSLITLALLQALTRADVAFSFFAGTLLLACSPLGKQLRSPRVLVACTSAIAALLAILVQAVLSKRIYPDASYRDTKVFQVLVNLELLSIVPFVLFMLPVAFTAWCVLRRRADTEPSWLALLLGATPFVPLWCIIGRIAEVRIFLPFAMALIPLTVSCFIRTVRSSLALSIE